MGATKSSTKPSKHSNGVLKKSVAYVFNHKLVAMIALLALVFAGYNAALSIGSVVQKNKLENVSKKLDAINEEVVKLLPNSTTKKDKFCEKLKPGYSLKTIDCQIEYVSKVKVQPQEATIIAKSFVNTLAPLSSASTNTMTPVNDNEIRAYIDTLYKGRNSNKNPYCFGGTNYDTLNREIAIKVLCRYKQAFRAFYPAKN